MVTSLSRFSLESKKKKKKNVVWAIKIKTKKAKQCYVVSVYLPRLVIKLQVYKFGILEGGCSGVLLLWLLFCLFFLV